MGAGPPSGFGEEDHPAAAREEWFGSIWKKKETNVLCPCTRCRRKSPGGGGRLRHL